MNKNTPVDYNDAQHLYTYQQKKYTSASQLYELFKEKFPEDAHIRYAEKYGGTPEYWKQQWAQKNKKSTDRGTAIHNIKEAELYQSKGENLGDIYLPVQDWKQEDIPWLQRPDGVYAEQKLWHHGYRIAGRADKITIVTDKNSLISRDDRPWDWWGDQGKRTAHISDHKTNERLDFKSYQFKSGNYKMMLPPLGHLMDCNWIHYCLQLSTYMFMLEYQGFQPGTITIIHHPHHTGDVPNPEPITYDVPYMKKEVVLMCTYNSRRNGF
jgi:hypothetical protein